MRKIVGIFLIVLSFLMSSCEKEYMCVCKNTRTGEKTIANKVKTTNLGKKGFEKSCKSNSTELQDCYVE